jgi:hypothetical protein
MWKNIEEPERPQTTIWRKRFACWIPKAINTHSQHEILIAFPQQQWLGERNSTLRFYAHGLSCLDFYGGCF